MRSGLITAILLIVIVVILSGCTQNQKTSKFMFANFSMNVSIIDGSGNNFNGTNLYTYVGFLSDSGEVYAWSGHPAFVDNNGHAYAFYSFAPVDPHDYIVFGAGLINSSLYDDWANKRFSPGITGSWKIWSYENITGYTNGNDKITINDTIFVSGETGKMIDAER